MSSTVIRGEHEIMEVVYEDYEHLQPIPRLYGYVGAAAALVAFLGLHRIVQRFAIPTAITHSKIRWKWKNICVSLIHSVIVGVWVLSSFYYYPEMTQDLVAFHNLYCYGVVVLSTGYFCSDFVDIVINSQVNAMWEVLLHHVVVLSIFTYNITVCRYIAYTNVALLAEVHSISLHLRKMMQMYGVSFHNIMYRLNNIINLVLFLGFRMLSIVWGAFGLLYHNNRMSTFYVLILGCAMFVMWIINLILLWRLIKSDFLRNMRNHAESGKKTQLLSASDINGINKNNKHNNFQKAL